MADIAPYLIDTGYVPFSGTFCLPITTNDERYEMMISALCVGGEVLYGEDEILHIVDFLNALPHVQEECAMPVASPNGYTFAPHQMKTVNGGFGSANFLNTTWHNAYYLMSGLNAEAEIDLLLRADDYSIHMLWIKGAASGDITAYLDGVSLGTVAGYNAANINSTWAWLANGVTEGEHTLSLKVTGKQPASSGYNFPACLFYVRSNTV